MKRLTGLIIILLMVGFGLGQTKISKLKVDSIKIESKLFIKGTNRTSFFDSLNSGNQLTTKNYEDSSITLTKLSATVRASMGGGNGKYGPDDSTTAVKISGSDTLIQVKPSYESGLRADWRNDLKDTLAATDHPWNTWVKGQVADTFAIRQYGFHNVRQKGALGDGSTDDRAAIQAALDLKGHVYVPYTGHDYIIGGALYIDSDTRLTIESGVTIYLKNGSNDYLLKSKNTEGIVYPNSPASRCSNIIIEGGIWDNNGSNNTNGAYSGGNWPGHGFFLWQIDGLIIRNTFHQNSDKFAILVTDVTDGYFSNIGFNNGSDGLHFWPPVDGVTINNMYGYTGDDMIAFVGGSYSTYDLGYGYAGNQENVIINGIQADGCLHAIRMTGSGNGNGYWFKNFDITNINGSTTGPGITTQNDGGGNQQLKYTFVKDVQITNWNLTCTTAQLTADSTINMYLEGVKAQLTIGTDSSYIRNLTLAKTELYDTLTARMYWIEGDIDRITFNDIVYKIRPRNGFLMNIRSNADITDMRFNDCLFYSDASALASQDIRGIYTNSGCAIDTIFFDNCIFENLDYVFRLTMNTVIDFSNVTMRNVTDWGTITNASTVRVIGNNIKYGNDYEPDLTTGGSNYISVDNPDFKIDYTQSNFTPVDGDRFYNTYGTRCRMQAHFSASEDSVLVSLAPVTYVYHTETIDLPSVSAKTNYQLGFTLTGCNNSDPVIVSPPSNWESKMIYSGVSGSDYYTLGFYNTKTVALDQASGDWIFRIPKFFEVEW